MWRCTLLGVAFALALGPACRTPASADGGAPAATAIPSRSAHALPSRRPGPVPQLLRAEIAGEYPHDPRAFTQGLLLYDGALYESTGLYGRSTLRRVDLETGAITRKVDLPGNLFGEGLARVGERLIQLTWKQGAARVYDLASFEKAGEFAYATKGWGLCFDGELLIMSDGSNRLYFRDPSTFTIVRQLAVTREGRRLSGLNELECVGNRVYANVWPTDRIVEISKLSGAVLSVIDARSVFSPAQRAALGREAILNGIAYDSESDTFLITGKLWPKVFRVRFVPPAGRKTPEGSPRSTNRPPAGKDTGQPHFCAAEPPVCAPTWRPITSAATGPAARICRSPRLSPLCGSKVLDSPSDGKTRLRGGNPRIHVGVEFVNCGPGCSVRMGSPEPLVGPAAMCTNGINVCMDDSNCPSLARCIVMAAVMSLGDPDNTYVNLTGGAGDMHRCHDALAAAEPTAAMISGLVPNHREGRIHLRNGGRHQIDLEGGQQVVEIEAVLLGHRAQLTITGEEDTAAVLRVKGAFRVGTESEITLGGDLTPNHVIWNIEGPGRSVKLGRATVVPGTILAPQRPRIAVRSETKVNGALIGKRVLMGRFTTVEHFPFTPLIVDDNIINARLTVRKASLRYDSSSRRDNGRFKLTAILDDNDTEPASGGKGTSQQDLESGLVSIRLMDGDDFDAEVPLTNCRTSGRRTRCKGVNVAGEFAKATVKAIDRRDPNIYELAVVARRLGSGKTGSSQPRGPVTAILTQGSLTRMGDIGAVGNGGRNACSTRGRFSLFCRWP